MLGVPFPSSAQVTRETARCDRIVARLALGLRVEYLYRIADPTLAASLLCDAEEEIAELKNERTENTSFGDELARLANRKEELERELSLLKNWMTVGGLRTPTQVWIDIKSAAFTVL